MSEESNQKNNVWPKLIEKIESNLLNNKSKNLREYSIDNEIVNFFKNHISDLLGFLGKKENKELKGTLLSKFNILLQNIKSNLQTIDFKYFDLENTAKSIINDESIFINHDKYFGFIELKGIADSDPPKPYTSDVLCMNPGDC